MICLARNNTAGSLSVSPALFAPMPFYFGPAARRLFGWYYPARFGAERASAVVLCPPIGYEAVCTSATYRYLAERLSDAGYPVLRFDYDGTGDSFGSDEDSDRLQSWQDSIGYAIDTLRQKSARSEITLFGVRLGATLAAFAAAERGDVTNLLLWAGFPNGRSYLREQRALHAARVRANAASPLAESLPYEEAAGFVVTRETADELLQFDTSSLNHRPAQQALLMDRDDLPNEKRLGERLAALGTAGTRVKWPGYAAMMRDTQETEIPIFAIDSMIDWLNEHVARSSEASARPGPEFPPESCRLETETYTEEPLVCDTGVKSFGILTSPQQKNSHSTTAILLLSVGANPHIGPNRMYVTLARQLASQGFSVLRLDIPGVGESADGAVTGRKAIYSASAIADVTMVMSELEKQIGADSFALVGLCSGAYMAFRIAGDDPRVKAQVLINPQTFEWREGDSLEIRLSQSYKQTRLYITSLNDRKTLKRILRGQVNTKGIAGALLKRMSSKLALVLRHAVSLATKLRPFETSVSRTFRAIADRGTNTLFVFADEDFGIEVTASHIGPKAQRIRGSEQTAYRDHSRRRPYVHAQRGAGSNACAGDGPPEPDALRQAAMLPEANAVHLWFASQDCSPTDMDRLWHLLSTDERARAARLISPKDRNRFIAARGLLRTLLDRYWEDKSVPLAFAYSSAGKPSLAGDTNLQFNLAHSDNTFLLGITRGRRIGVDIERIDTETDCSKLADRFFSSAEQSDWNRLPISEKNAAWFRRWTLKEAYLKAVGAGLAQALDTVEVSAGDPPRFLRIAGDAAEAALWQPVVIPSAPIGFAAAVVTEGKAPPEIRYHYWEW